VKICPLEYDKLPDNILHFFAGNGNAPGGISGKKTVCFPDGFKEKSVGIRMDYY